MKNLKLKSLLKEDLFGPKKKWKKWVGVWYSVKAKPGSNIKLKNGYASLHSGKKDIIVYDRNNLYQKPLDFPVNSVESKLDFSETPVEDQEGIYFYYKRCLEFSSKREEDIPFWSKR